MCEDDSGSPNFASPNRSKGHGYVNFTCFELCESSRRGIECCKETVTLLQDQHMD